MPDFYRVEVRDVRDQFLTCLVTEVCRHDDAFLEASPSLAFGFLWDALGYEENHNSAFPLAEVVAGRYFFDDYDWTAATAERIVSCIGLTDYRVVVVGADGKWTHMTPGGDAAQATLNVAVTDPRWLEHTGRESGEWEWESRVRSVTTPPDFDPAWRTPAVLALARRIAGEQEFATLPALADALQSAGCDAEGVLRHFRGPGPHVCGCWALELVLGSRWLASDDPEAMLRELGVRVSERKLRLFACACCRRVEGWAEMADREGRGDDYRNAVAVAERFADGAVTAVELAVAHRRTDSNVLSRGERCYSDPFGDVTNSVIWRAVQAAEHIREVFFDLEPPVGDVSPQTPAVAKASRERVAQAALLRDLFGNVFRPVAFSASWRTDTVLALARQMYEAREFSAMPILADALQDAGCDNDDILNHCRDTSLTHVRGCWVVDVILGKE